MKGMMPRHDALSICGSLSKPCKTPGHGYSLPALTCRLGGALRLMPNTVCDYCYALRGPLCIFRCP